MSEWNSTVEAKAMYDAICQTLDAREFHYQKNDEDMTVFCSAKGDDLPMDVIIRVDERKDTVSMLSRLPLVFDEDKRLNAAVITSVINNKLICGCFDFNINEGTIYFRLTSSYVDSHVSGEVISCMLGCAFHTIDDYNDKLFMFAKGMIGFEQLISTLTD